MPMLKSRRLEAVKNDYRCTPGARMLESASRRSPSVLDMGHLPLSASPRALPLLDQRNRALRDLRISVTDRCNFRCAYCMPKEVYGPGFRFLKKARILSFEEIARLARVFRDLGARKLRLTGGEPLLRAELPKLIAQLVPLQCDLAMTTNGSLLGQHAAALKDAGLQRVTVSVDSVDPEVFARMNAVGFPLDAVLRGIDAALRVGLVVKANCVVRKGVNDHTLVETARYFKARGCTLRFIEYMDVGLTNGWRLDEVLSASEIVQRVARELPLEGVSPSYDGEVARRYRYADGQAELGVITSVTKPFCGSCTRARLSAEGKLYTCLFAADGVDLREPLRSGVDDVGLQQLIARVWGARADAYSEQRHLKRPGLRRVEMSHIGG